MHQPIGVPPPKYSTKYFRTYSSIIILTRNQDLGSHTAIVTQYLKKKQKKKKVFEDCTGSKNYITELESGIYLLIRVAEYMFQFIQFTIPLTGLGFQQLLYVPL